MKRIVLFTMLAASMIVMTCCTNDPFEDIVDNGSWNSNGKSYFGDILLAGSTASGGSSVTLSSYSGGAGMGGRPGGWR